MTKTAKTHTHTNTLTVAHIEAILQRAAALARKAHDVDTAEHLDSASFFYAAEERYITEAIKQLQTQGKNMVDTATVVL